MDVAEKAKYGRKAANLVRAILWLYRSSFGDSDWI